MSKTKTKVQHSGPRDVLRPEQETRPGGLEVSKRVQFGDIPPPDRSKTITLYANGDEHFYGKTLVVNRRHMVTWDMFLHKATEKTDIVFAARYITTPTHGTKINGFDELTDGSGYVVVSKGNFKPIGYTTLQERHQQKVKKNEHHLSDFLSIRPVEHSSIKVPGRVRLVPIHALTICVYGNGNEYDGPHRVAISPREIGRYDAILRLVGERVTSGLIGAPRALYTTHGVKISDASQLVNGQEYVAVGLEMGGRFQYRDYGLTSLWAREGRRIYPFKCRRLCEKRYARSIFVSAAQKRKWQSTDELPVTSQPDHPTGIRKMSVLPAIATQSSETVRRVRRDTPSDITVPKTVRVDGTMSSVVEGSDETDESSESSLPNADRAADFPPPSSIDDFADDDETFSDRPAIYADYDLPDLDDLLPPSIDEDYDLRDLDDPFLPSPSVVDRTGVYPEDDVPDDENDPTDVSRPQDGDRSSTTTVTIESQFIAKQHSRMDDAKSAPSSVASNPDGEMSGAVFPPPTVPERAEQNRTNAESKADPPSGAPQPSDRRVSLVSKAGPAEQPRDRRASSEKKADPPAQPSDRRASLVSKAGPAEQPSDDDDWGACSDFDVDDGEREQYVVPFTAAERRISWDADVSSAETRRRSLGVSSSVQQPTASPLLASAADHEECDSENWGDEPSQYRPAAVSTSEPSLQPLADDDVGSELKFSQSDVLP